MKRYSLALLALLVIPIAVANATPEIIQQGDCKNLLNGVWNISSQTCTVSNYVLSSNNSLTIPAKTTLIITGKFINSGIVTNNGILVNRGTVENFGTIATHYRLDNFGVLTNHGKITSLDGFVINHGTINLLCGSSYTGSTIINTGIINRC